MRVRPEPVMRRLLAIVVLVLLLAAPGAALAGAWPRGEGAFFASLSHTLSRGVPLRPEDETDGFTSLFAEYGLTPKLTFGLDAGSGETGSARSGRVFLRRSLDPAGPNVFAGQLGVGLYAPGERGEAEPLARLGASWGRGIEVWGIGGWLGTEAVTEYRTGSEEALVKLDTTFGLNLSDRRLAILQLQAGDYPGSDPYLRIVPTVVQRVTPSLQVETGFTAEVIGEAKLGLKVSVWFER